MNPPETQASAQPSALSTANPSAYQAADAAGETVAGGQLLVAAYAIAWIVVFVFVVHVFRRQSAVARRVDAIEADLRKRSG